MNVLFAENTNSIKKVTTIFANIDSSPERAYKYFLDDRRKKK